MKRELNKELTRKMYDGAEVISVNLNFLISILNGFKEEKKHSVCLRIKSGTPLLIDDIVMLADREFIGG